MQRMSETWKYTSTDGLIAEICCQRGKFPKYLHLYPWIVVFRDGTEAGLYHVNPDDYTGPDKAAIEAAMKNAQELRLKYSETTVQQVVNNNTCCIVS